MRIEIKHDSRYCNHGSSAKNTWKQDAFRRKSKLNGYTDSYITDHNKATI